MPALSRFHRPSKLLSTSTGGLYVHGSGSSTLAEAYESIVTILRGSYLLGYYPQVEEDAAAASELTTVGGKDESPCLIVDGNATYESADIVSGLVAKVAPLP